MENTMNAHSLIKGAVAVSLTAGLLFIASIILRQLLILNVIVPFLLANYLVFLAFIVIGALCWRDVSLSLTEIVLIALLIVTMSTASYDGRQAADIAIDVFKPFAFILTVAVTRSLAMPQNIFSDHRIRFLIAVHVPVTLFGVFLCRLVEFVTPMYPAYSSVDSLLGLGWLLASGGLWGPLAYFGVLLISGKRGVVLAGAFILALFYRRAFSFGRMTAVAGSIVIAGLSISALGGFEALQRTLKISGVESGVSYQAKFSKFSGGRSDEIIDATNSVESPFRYIFGEGPGFAYKSALFEESAFGGPLLPEHRYLHFSPMSLLIYFGVGFLAVFSIYLFEGACSAWRLFSATRDPATLAISAYFLSSLVFALTEFSIFSYANFAISFGLVQADKKQRR
jgi:hypothetical protein